MSRSFLDPDQRIPAGGLSSAGFSRQPGSVQSDGFSPDLEYEASPGIGEALSAVRSGAPVVFISGRAGSGKSRLIDYLKKIPGGRSMVVTAPTGIAAMNLDAVTLHSAFRLPIGVIDSSRLEEERISKAFRTARRIVIDEISMVRADVLDAVDKRLRDVREDDRPFGGAQIIMVGDFLQLPPIVRPEDRRLLEKMGYDTPFAFSAHVLRSTPIRVATLTKVWRQSDPEMIAVLGDIREGRHTAEAVAWLNRRCSRPHREGVVPMLLTATRAAADEYNLQGFAGLQDETTNSRNETVFLSEKDGVFGKDSSLLPAPDRLKLAPGLRVMAVKNDANGRYVNGSLGTVMSCHISADDPEEEFVRVLFDGSADPAKVSRSKWTKSRQSWSESAGGIVEELIGEFRQIPLVHGYAITIHKSQGLSLDDVRVDLGRGAFAPGQLYVALSRARSPEGLSLARPITAGDVRVDELLVKFLQWAKTSDNLVFERELSS